jgi:hypothetical protein
MGQSAAWVRVTKARRRSAVFMRGHSIIGFKHPLGRKLEAAGYFNDFSIFANMENTVGLAVDRGWSESDTSLMRKCHESTSDTLLP